MSINYFGVIGVGTAFLAGTVVAAFTVLPSMVAIDDGLSCVSTECSDLAAQRSMAVAAWAMVGLSFAATVVGGASLGLIAWTLDAARRSATAAERAADHASGSLTVAQSVAADTRRYGVAQTRAYLTANSATVACDEHLRIKIFLANSGSTPARHVHTRIRVRMEILTDTDGPPTIHERETPEIHLADFGAGHSEPIQISVEQVIDDLDYEDYRRGYVTVMVTGDIAYQDVFGDVHPYAFGFIGHPDADDPANATKIVRIASEAVPGLSWV